ncbi:MAG: Na+/H+ antiporter subunit E [Acidimicrobiia bacterium]|nr:Na+/H+ antiporter subunit E [Acidimicrobiia bacterium]
MSRWFTLRRLITVAALTFAWCALWGEPSVANLASGIVVATLVSGSGIGTPGRGRIRIRPLVRFGLLVAIDLGVSTVSVAREILTPTDYTDEAVIAVAVPTDTRTHLLLLIVAITVTPGTAVVDADPDTGTLYLHILHAERRHETEAHVVELAQLACQALPTHQPQPLPSHP